MANIEFKGFKLIYANGGSVNDVLRILYPDINNKIDGILYLVRSDADGKDGYLVLNGKVYGSAEKAIAALDATVSTSGTTYISGTTVEENGKLTSFTIDETELISKFTKIDNAITAITGDTGTIKNAIKDLDATVSAVTTTGATKYIDSTIVEEDGKLKSFTINETKLDTKIGNIETSINDITKAGGTIDAKVSDAVSGVNMTITEEIEGVNGKIKTISDKVNENGMLIGGLQKSVTDITEKGGTIDAKIAELDATVSGTSTNSHITVKVVQADGMLTGVEVKDTLGTAAKANVSEGDLSIPTGNTSEKAGLATAKQVENFVKASVADLAGAMHFKGVVDTLPQDKSNYNAGDIILVGTKEYVLNVTKKGQTEEKAWVELGDESIYLTTENAVATYVTKATTIAGVDLRDSITKDELLTALNVANGAQVNVLEGVKVNGTALEPDGEKKVNITVTSGTANGTIKVNNVDVAVHGLGSAAYTNSNAYDASGTATTEIAKISGTTSGTSTNSYITVATTQENGKVTGITVNDSALKTTIDGINDDIAELSGATVTSVNDKTGHTITLTGADVAVGADVDGAGGTMAADSKVSDVLADIYTKLNTANTNAYTGITAANNTVTVNPTTHGHSVAVKLKELSPNEKASGLIQLVADENGIYGKLFFDGEERVLPKNKVV